jgi:glucuronoarabinoxylan endo-1,4-beta-xylanase
LYTKLVGAKHRINKRGNMQTKYLSIYLFLIAFLSLAPSYGADNILTNPGFETGTTTGWSGFGCSISAVTVPHTGSCSCLTSNRSGTWSGPRQSILGLISDGQTCTISGWVKLQNASSDSIAITVAQNDDSDTTFHPVVWSTGYDDVWTYLSGDFTLDVNGTLTELFFYFEGPAAGVNFYVDDVSLIGTDPDPNHATAQVDAVIRHQKIEGFGASGAWYEGWLTAHPKRDEIYDVIFGELGTDIYRLRNTHDISQSNIIDSAEIIAQGEASLGRELKIMISSWTPPDYLKTDGNTVGGTLAKDANGNYKYSEFAQWWLESLDAYEANGITVEYVSMQNEPAISPLWDGCRFTPTETNEYAGYNLAFEALSNKFSTIQNPPKLLAPETLSMSKELSDNYIGNIIDSNHIYGYAHHLYGDADPNEPDNFIPKMTNFAEQYSDKPIFQTEYHLGNQNFFAAMNLAVLMHNSLAIEGVSVYMHWPLFWAEPGGLVSLEFPWGSNPGYTVNPIYYAFKHYSAFIHSGWRRLDVSNDSLNPRISAYISPDNQQMSVVLINIDPNINVELDLSFDNFSVEDGNVYRTSSTQNCELIGDFNDSAPLILPAESITTLALSGTLIITDCQQVQDAGLNLAGDLNGNCYVDLADVSVLTDQWLSTDPVAISPNYSPDIYADDKVNLLDFAVLALDWLICNNPQDANCLKTW